MHIYSKIEKMKQFDYKEYLKNNPLLKEDIEEGLKHKIRKDLEKVSGLKISKDDKKIKELQDELEELDMEIYRIEEELAELEEEGEDTSGLVDDLNKLEKYRDKFIAKLEKLK
jgi:septal ring factor EnvC (AmiA/AmiB activator)